MGSRFASLSSRACTKRRSKPAPEQVSATIHTSALNPYSDVFAVPPISADFESVIADYLPPSTTQVAAKFPPVLPLKLKSGDFLDGLV